MSDVSSLSDMSSIPSDIEHSLGVETPIGRLLLVGNDRAITNLLLPASAPSPAASSYPGPGEGGARVPDHLREGARQLGQYFEGSRTAFHLPLEMSGTDFQCQVWQTLGEIPYARTISYGELAQMVGRPKAFRAVGNANGKNPLPVIIPCHRVIAGDGGIGGYGGGLNAKRWLLDLESKSKA